MPVRSDAAVRREIVAFLGALCLFLSAVEYLIPKPLPFLRLGLANLPLLLGLGFLRPADLAAVLLLKVLGQGLVNGTLASYVFLFSFAGSAASLAAMTVMARLGRRRVSLVGVSLSGALASALVQLALSLAFVFGASARPIAPLSLGSALAAGLLMGIFAERFSRTSQWLAALETRYRGAFRQSGDVGDAG